MKMIRTGVVFFDSGDTPHAKPEDAAASSIVKLMGKNGENGASLLPVARELLSRRAELIELFEQLDAAKTLEQPQENQADNSPINQAETA